MIGKWAPLLLLSPLGSLLKALNNTIIRHEAPSLPWLAYAGTWAILGLLAAWKIFEHAEASFAESI
jgi:ABC-type polysaccharide/polyol phosphate export permease